MNRGRLALSMNVGEQVVIGDPDNPIGFVNLVEIDSMRRVSMAFAFDKDVRINRERVIEAERAKQ